MTVRGSGKLWIVSIALLAPIAGRAGACPADCDGDQRVDVAELIAAVDVALGSAALERCPQVDANRDGAASIDEVARAVAVARGACPDAAVAAGTCARSGAAGLVPCAPGSALRAVECWNPVVCLDELPEPGSAEILSAATVAEGGVFSLHYDRRGAGAVPIVLDAEVDPVEGVHYRALRFPNGADLAGIQIDPSSEAAVRLLDARGLENFGAGLEAIEKAVRAATANETFAGLTAAEAADRALAVASADPEVQAAIDAAFVPAAVMLHVGPAAGAAGAPAGFAVSLATGARSVVAVENLVHFEPSAPIGTGAGGRPRCAVNPAIHKDATSFSFQPPGCTPALDCEAVKAFVISLSDAAAIASGSVLYTCEVEVGADLLAGDAVPLACSTARYSGPNGPIPAPSAACTDGAVAVRGGP